MKLKKGDTIIVTTGKDRGRQAKIERVFLGEGKVLVPGLNQYKKHNKPQGENKPGEIVTLSRPYVTAKVALVCPKCKQQTRVGYKMLNDKKVRVCRKCDAVIE
jgi:large subunit ribosomal protein L24